MNHSLRLNDIDRRFILLDNSIEFTIGRSIIICMDNCIFNKITCMNFGFKFQFTEKMIIYSICFSCADRTRSGSHYLFKMMCIFSIPCQRVVLPTQAGPDKMKILFFFIGELYGKYRICNLYRIFHLSISSSLIFQKNQTGNRVIQQVEFSDFRFSSYT